MSKNQYKKIINWKNSYVCGTCGRALASENFLETGSFRMGAFGKRFPSDSFRGGRGSSTFSTGFIFFFLILTGGGLNITLLAILPIQVCCMCHSYYGPMESDINTNMAMQVWFGQCNGRNKPLGLWPSYPLSTHTTTFRKSICAFAVPIDIDSSVQYH